MDMDDVVLHHSISQFLLREARLLDERRFVEWLDLWSEDAAYLAPTNWANVRDGLREASDCELHHLRSNKDMLRLRVKKLDSGTAWAEEPPSRTVRCVSNVEVRHVDDTLGVRSNIVLYRVRYTDDVEMHAGSRFDRLVPTGKTWRIVRRHVNLAHGVFCADDFEFFL